MTLNLSSSAPHISPAATWERSSPGPSHDSLILYKSENPPLEIGIRRWRTGQVSESFPLDELRHIIAGAAVYRGESGEIIEVEPGTAIHFKQGWRGVAEIREPLDAAYVRCQGGPAPLTPVLHNVLTAGPLKQWGTVSKPLEGVSQTAGILLSREPDRRAESGIWTCTPGLWRCELKSDEFCHFLEGSSTYTHDNGEVIEVRPDTLAYFPIGWKGQCRVHETVRKVYMIR
jgi:uncharacterized cupin superfamily protein